MVIIIFKIRRPCTPAGRGRFIIIIIIINIFFSAVIVVYTIVGECAPSIQCV